MGHTRKRLGNHKTKREYRIEIPQFITHVPISKSKYRKINGQNVYSGMNPHIRAKLMREMHSYLRTFVKTIKRLKPPISVKLEFYAPINFGTVRRLVDRKTGKARISWKEPGEGYEPRWDADNQWIWTKAFNDTLVQEGIIPDDNISHIKASGEVEWIPVDHIDDRKLVFVIKEV